MDMLSEAAVLFFSISYNPENISKLIWDNATEHKVVNEVLEQQKYPFFLLGWVFFGAFGTGFFIHCFYAVLAKRFFLDDDDDWDSRDGHFNDAYVDDESQPPENDHPPDYNSVVSGNIECETSRNQRFLNFLRKCVSKKETMKVDNQTEEMPPSYSTAVANLQGETNSS